MALTGAIVPLNNVTVVAILKEQDGRTLHKFLRERLSIEGSSADKLICSVVTGSYWDSWMDLLQKMKNQLQGFFGDGTPRPSFVGVVSADRVLKAIIGKVKLDIANGKPTVVNGSLNLTENNIKWFQNQEVEAWDFSRPGDLSHFELEIAIEKIQSEKKGCNLGAIDRRLRSPLEKVAKQAVSMLEEKGILKPKCKICKRMVHNGDNVDQEKNCPNYRSQALCIQCGKMAKEGCYRGISSSIECSEVNECSNAECKGLFPKHATKLHEASAPAAAEIKKFYGPKFKIKETKRSSTKVTETYSKSMKPDVSANGKFKGPKNNRGSIASNWAAGDASNWGANGSSWGANRSSWGANGANWGANGSDWSGNGPDWGANGSNWGANGSDWSGTDEWNNTAMGRGAGPSRGLSRPWGRGYGTG